MKIYSVGFLARYTKICTNENFLVYSKVYKVLYIHVCDTVPPCSAHVHMLTIIQFLRARANIHTFLEG